MASERCGSYPFMYIAQDFSVPYGVTLRVAQAFADHMPVAWTDDDAVWTALDGDPVLVADFRLRLRQANGEFSHAQANAA